MRVWIGIAAVAIGLAANGGENLERKTCGFWEGPAFRAWRRVAHRYHPKTEPQNVLPYSMKTVDGRMLRGYKLPATSAPNSAIIVIQGNAMTAATIADDLGPLRTSSDVFILDFRGYVKSEGLPRFAALLSDYRQLLGVLRSTGYRRVYVYGASLGGVIASKLISAGADAVVIDSAPATVVDQGCPASYNPTAQLSASCSNVMVISGGSDPIIKPEKAKSLVDKVRACGGKALTPLTWSHPFTDSAAITKDRLTRAQQFFAARGTN